MNLSNRRLGLSVLCLLLAWGSSLSTTAAWAQDPSPSDVAGLDPFPVGAGMVVADFGGIPLNLHYFKPGNYAAERFILVFHGASRTAGGYRDSASGMALRYKALVVVPEFDLERFPNRLHQQGGVFREDGSMADAEERTYALVPKIVDYIRAREDDLGMSHLILGFSAGGQFVERMAAFLDTEAERLIVTSPGSTMFPNREMRFGLGFGGLPDEYSSDDRIRRYLAQPITIYIGTEDTEMAQLPTGSAYGQGVHRYSRNIRWFNEAMDLAYKEDWPFNWRLVIADGPGHSPPDMFNHPQIENALFGHRK